MLFPGARLPLHVFEPRYRLMIGRCLAMSSPFGVVLIEAGLEVGTPAVPYHVGTRATITDAHTLSDGRMHIVCLGTERFRLLDLRQDEPYLTARVEPYPPDVVEPDAASTADDLYIALSRISGTAANTPSSHLDPTVLSFALAAALPLPLAERQALLELTSTSERLHTLKLALARELRLRERMGTTRPAAPGAVPPPSPN